MLEQVAKNIRERSLFRDGERILVAVSGGVDSMVLLYALHDLAIQRGWELTVAHFNHQLRGRASDADETFVRKTAERLGLPCVVDRADVKAHAARSGQSIEMAARELRHAFLARTAKRLKAKSIALAHQADDQVELFFLRLLRGASVEGLAGMRWRNSSPTDKSIQLVRPLLNISRAEVRAFAAERKINWREDTSNRSMDFLRNRVRRELIPLLTKDYQPGLRNNILRLTELLRAEAEVVTYATNEAIRSKTAFEQLPVAIQRRVIQQQLFRFGVAADFATTEALRLHVGKVIELNPTTRIVRDERGRVRGVEDAAVHFCQASQTLRLKSGVTTAQLGDCEVTMQIVEASGAKLTSQTKTESFDADLVGRDVVLRHWQAGDRFQPIGSKSSRKLQDMFVDLKIPKAERHVRVVATTAAGEIFWVEGLRIGEKFKLTSATERRLIVKWARR